MGSKKAPKKQPKGDKYADKAAVAQQARAALDERWAKRPQIQPTPVLEESDQHQAGEP